MPLYNLSEPKSRASGYAPRLKNVVERASLPAVEMALRALHGRKKCGASHDRLAHLNDGQGRPSYWFFSADSDNE
jgi:hypothetical protein